MGFVWMVAAAVAAVLASWAFNALVHLVWRPHAITKKLRAQGVGGPDYKFFVGNLDEIKRLRAEGAGVVRDVASHDFIPIVQPHFRKWISLYGADECVDPESVPMQHTEHTQQPEEEGEPQGPHFCELCCGGIYD